MPHGRRADDALKMTDVFELAGLLKGRHEKKRKCETAGSEFLLAICKNPVEIRSSSNRRSLSKSSNDAKHFYRCKFGLQLNRLESAHGENCPELLRSLLFISDLLQM